MGDKTDEVQEALVKILVAEDSAVDRMILESMLRKGGYHVIMAEDGLQAVEQFERHNPDLVFLDVLLSLIHI